MCNSNALQVQISDVDVKMGIFIKKNRQGKLKEKSWTKSPTWTRKRRTMKIKKDQISDMDAKIKRLTMKRKRRTMRMERKFTGRKRWNFSVIETDLHLLKFRTNRYRNRVLINFSVMETEFQISMEQNRNIRFYICCKMCVKLSGKSMTLLCLTSDAKSRGWSIRRQVLVLRFWLKPCRAFVSTRTWTEGASWLKVARSP